MEAGTFAASLHGSSAVPVRGSARWFTRRAPMRTERGEESFIVLHTRGPDAYPDTAILLYRQSEPFRRRRYPIYPFGRSGSPDPVGDVVVRSHWDEQPEVWQSRGGGRLRITRADDRLIEGEFEFGADRVGGDTAGPRRLALRGRFSAIHEVVP